MAIRHWHPAKLFILWVLDLALLLLLVLRKPCETTNVGRFVFTDCSGTIEWVILWLILSLPVFIITWRWGTWRQQAIGSNYENQPHKLPSETGGGLFSSRAYGFFMGTLLVGTVVGTALWHFKAHPTHIHAIYHLPQGAPPVWIECDAPSSEEEKEFEMWDCGDR